MQKVVREDCDNWSMGGLFLAKRRSRRTSTRNDLVSLGLILIFAMYAFRHHTAIVIIILLLIIAGIGTWVYFAIRAQQKLVRSGIDAIDRMDGREFEEYLVVLFRKLGFSKVRATRYTGDFGADVVMEKTGERHVIQAKCYSNNVGVKAVQEVVAAKAHYSAGQAWVVTNARFTPAARSLAGSNDVRLIDRDELIKLILSIQAQQKRAGAGEATRSSSL